MKPRAKLLTLPSPLPDRYWVIDHPPFGPLTFRHPYYGVSAAIMTYLRAHHTDPEVDARDTETRFLDTLPLAGVVIGACWHHPAIEMETPLVPADPERPRATPPASLAHLTDAQLMAYGHAVCEEMQEADYTLIDIVSIYAAATTEFGRRQKLDTMIAARVDFSAAPKDDSTRSSSSTEPGTLGAPTPPTTSPTTSS